MTYFELYNLIPEVIADNSYELLKAEKYADDLEAAADEEQTAEIAKLRTMINNRRNMLARIGDKLQKSIYELALLSHNTKGFEPVQDPNGFEIDPMSKD